MVNDGLMWQACSDSSAAWAIASTACAAAIGPSAAATAAIIAAIASAVAIDGPATSTASSFVAAPSAAAASASTSTSSSSSTSSASGSAVALGLDRLGLSDAELRDDLESFGHANAGLTPFAFGQPPAWLVAAAAGGCSDLTDVMRSSSLEHQGPIDALSVSSEALAEYNRCQVSK